MGSLPSTPGGTSLDPNLTVNISDSTISDNQINHGESPESVYGAGLSPEDGVWNVTGTTITGNGPLDDAYDLVGSGVNVFTPGLSQTQTFSNDTITDNTAYDGGGVVLDGGTTTISNSTIDGNSGTEAFGGILDETYYLGRRRDDHRLQHNQQQQVGPDWWAPRRSWVTAEG